MYAPRGKGGVNSPMQFHCALHAKREGGGPDSMSNCVHTIKIEGPYDQ